MNRVTRAALLGAAAASLFAPAAPAQSPEPYGTNDGGGFSDILPSGTRGLYNLTELGTFLAFGTTVPHCCEQLPMYGNLVYATPGLKASDLSKYFKDGTFGVRNGEAERTYSPRADVTIVREKVFGKPKIYGKDRSGAMFGLGYIAAEDRLFFMDVLRHAGRSELASFAGGANAAMDIDVWSSSPYREEDLQRQVDQLDDLYGADGKTVQEDVANYVAGLNAYITAAQSNPNLVPGEYAALNHPEGPQPWKATDVIATAALVGGIFGKGDGSEIDVTELYHGFRKRVGAKKAERYLRDFRADEDPESPTTVIGKTFRYQVRPRKPAKGSVAIWDDGSLERHQVVTARSGGNPPGSATPLLDGLSAFPKGGSNAVIISAARSKSGRPLMVAGPQTGYFNPQILMEQEIHAPAVAGKPGIDAAGAAFIGVNLYVQLGRGRDYAWSATSAGQDNIDTFALELCEASGGAPTKKSMSYRFRGQCLPIEVIEKTVSWQSSAGDATPNGSMTLRAERTKLGLVAARATVGGKPVIYTRLRSTYFHEVDSAVGFMDFNDPAKITGPAAFQRAAHRIGYTFNWLYADSKDTAYFNSGWNPVRARGVHPWYPAWGGFEWKDYDPDTGLSAQTPFAEHPQAINQPYFISWNNKQAPGYRAGGPQGFTSTYRSVLLEDRVKTALRGGGKLDLPGTVDIMETAGVADLRGHTVLHLALKLIGTPADPAAREAVAKLRAWRAAGSPRKDADQDRVYEHSDAVQIMDAWWPLMLKAIFEPRLGRDLQELLERRITIDNDPNNHGDHLGSAYQGGWYGYARKALRQAAGRRVRGGYAYRYCGNGSRRRCAGVLEASLVQALAVPKDKVYPGDGICPAGDQWCWDAVRQRPVGGATQPLIHWINRPTYQQANEIQRAVGR